jgi:xanthine/CO dehydrogenase XdhC/CoxF family maturation factor
MRAFEERARERGLTTKGVRCPIGLDVGAQTPAEIAVAVAAEIIRDVKASRSLESHPETIA